MIYRLLWYFFIYSFLGWCGEVCFAAARLRKFVNRGFLNGPICPIYGVGMTVVALVLGPVQDHLVLLFICSVLLTSALEWLTGFVLEHLFHQRWWNYNDRPLNLGGYICLEFSLLWGVACLVVMKVIHPLTAELVSLIPHGVGVVLLTLFMVVLVVDVSATVAAMVGLHQRLRQLDELAARIHAASDELGLNISDRMISSTERFQDLRDDFAIRTADLREDLAGRAADLREDLTERAAGLREDLAELRAKQEKLLSARPFGQRRLLKAFPTMTSSRYAAALSELRRRLAVRSRKNDKTDKKAS